MTSYPLVVSLHVLAAVLGLGPILAIAVLASLAPVAPLPLPPTLRLLQLLSRVVTLSLVVILLTGVLATYLVHGAFAETWWYRGSFGLFLLCGFSLGRVRGALRRAGAAPPEQATPALRTVQRYAWGACALVAVVVVLMEAKPA